MINTVLLHNEAENFKDFNYSNVVNLTHKVVKSAAVDISRFNDTYFAPNFEFTSGNVYLEPNTVFCIEYINEKRDLVLPKNPKPLDWVSLWHEQHTVIFDLTNVNKRPIKLYGNGSRIMGLDEPLICDIEFQTLKLTFLNDIEGWVIV